MNLKRYRFTKNELENIIVNSKQYYGHLSNDGFLKEGLIDHLLLVQDYCFHLIKSSGLEITIISLIDRISDIGQVKDIVLELFIKSMVIHDFGKLNPEFQRRKMQNNISGIDHKLSSGHSLISAYLFILYGEKLAKKSGIPPELESFIDFLILIFAYPILRHHAPGLSQVFNQMDFSDKIVDLKKFLLSIDDIGDSDFLSEIEEYVIKNTSVIFSNILNSNKNIKDPFLLFALLKLNYSLLTASDYYATTHFMKNWGSMYEDFGVLNNDLKRKIIYNVENLAVYNKKTYQELNGKQPDFVELESTNNNNNLNLLRQKLAGEVIHGVRANLNKNLFYIEAPTGSGKTNLSMLALAEFLRSDVNSGTDQIKKIFYVFPFTTLITQTFDSLKETLGVDDNEIIQIHSKAGFSIKGLGEDDLYGGERDNLIDYQFVNFPIVLLSHIKFFDILKSNKKSSNYLLHQIANSIVIIDELQSYSPKQWDKIIYYVKNYAKYFNIKFILMSATLPKIDKLLSEQAHRTEGKQISCYNSFVYLNPHKDKYFINPNFSQRVQFDFSMLSDSLFDKNKRNVFLENLWQKIAKESNDYHKINNRVHTIIEFIYKKTASEFYETCKKENRLFDEIFLLSGTTIEPRRKEIIGKLKSKEYQQKNILLITTQVVEAGVDIDMDLGFKDSSLIDSDEQLAGRINRNINKKKCKLFLFDLDDANVIYKKDKRYEFMQSQLADKYYEILETKNFDFIYDAVMVDRNNHNKQSDYIDNLPGYLSEMKNLNFPELDKSFKLIENDEVRNITIFAPVKVPIKIPFSSSNNFTKNELEFLKGKNVIREKQDFIDGRNIWELYENVIKNKDIDFTNQKIQIITLQGLMSKFSFSLGVYSKAFQNMQINGNVEEKYGYYYLHNVAEVYDYNDGIKNLEKQNAFIW